MAHAHGHDSQWLPPRLACRAAGVCFVLVFVLVLVLRCCRIGIVSNWGKPSTGIAEEGSLGKVRPNGLEETEEPEESRESWGSWRTVEQAWSQFDSMLVEEECCWLGLGEEPTVAVQTKADSGVRLGLIL